MARRTRACQPCRRFRIRCDETLPQCQQCQRAGRSCPGPLDGPIIVDMTVTAADRRGSNYGHREGTATYPVADFSQDLFGIRGPTGRHVITGMLVAQFIAFFCGGRIVRIRKPWMFEYQDIPSDGTMLRAVEWSVHAVALAHFAVYDDAPGAIVQALELYTKALKIHRSFVGSITCDVAIQPSVAFELVSSTVVLAYFEAEYSTHSAAYIEHIVAATKFLELIGVEQCSRGGMNQLFFSVRAQMALICVATNKPMIFTSSEWMNLPVEGFVVRPVSERVTDGIIVLLEISNLYNNTLLPDMKDRLYGAVYGLRIHMTRLWNDYVSEGQVQTEPLLMDGPHLTRTYRDSITAMTISLFDCVWLLLESFATRESSDMNISGSLSVPSCDSILSCAAYLGLQKIGCAYVRMMLPLLLVARHGLLARQRQASRDILRQWHSERRVQGLCSLVLDCLGDERFEAE